MPIRVFRVSHVTTSRHVLRAILQAASHGGRGGRGRSGRGRNGRGA